MLNIDCIAFRVNRVSHMLSEDEKILDFGTYRKLKEIEQNLREEMDNKNLELTELINKKDEYIIHLLRILLSKVDSIDTAAQNRTAGVQEEPEERKSKSHGILRMLNNSLSNYIGI